VAEVEHGHEPVLVGPVVHLLHPQPGQVVLDGTVGSGAHAAALIPRICPGGRYVGIDLDEAMVGLARERLAGAPHGTVQLFVGNFAEFPVCLREAGLAQMDHLFLDLGVNSLQLADAARGFSFERDGPLDMRYSREQTRQAIDLVNGMSERDLADLFYQFGQEGLSRKIAKRICDARRGGRIRTTRTLARVVEAAVTAGGKRSRGRIHPATRVFQALRVAVNEELDNLERCLSQVTAYLRPGGRFAVISFHSLEDGIVKRFLRTAKAEGTMRELTKRPVIAGSAERAANPRSRSAKLRVAERLET
jgi:16S rRNA (cytosine1402-N4)-methyltransferase